jgi:superfamily II DNA helicase RecQ
MPKSLEGYYQEAGRAGRDGAQSHCIIFYNYADKGRIESLLGDNENFYQKCVNMKALNLVTSYCEDEFGCRRQRVLEYFGQKFDPATECRQTCDNCSRSQDSLAQDIRADALSIVRLISDIGINATLLQVVQLWTGLKFTGAGTPSPSAEFGKGSRYARKDAEKIVRHLLISEFLQERQVLNPRNGIISYLMLGPQANTLNTLPSLILHFPKNTKATLTTTTTTNATATNARTPAKRRSSTSESSSTAAAGSGRSGAPVLGDASEIVHDEVFKALLELRTRIAAELRCAPYHLAVRDSLIQMIKERPQSYAAMQSIPYHHFSDPKHCQQIIDLISSFPARSPAEPPSSSTTTSSSYFNNRAPPPPAPAREAPAPKKAPAKTGGSERQPKRQKSGKNFSKSNFTKSVGGIRPMSVPKPAATSHATRATRNDPFGSYTYR